MLSSDGCQADKPACKAAAALMAFECSWCVVEGFMIFLTLWRYRETRFDGWDEDSKGGKAQWARAFQVCRAYSLKFQLICALLMCSVPDFLFCYVCRGSTLVIYTWMHRRARRHPYWHRRWLNARGGWCLWSFLHLALYSTDLLPLRFTVLRRFLWSICYFHCGGVSCANRPPFNFSGESSHLPIQNDVTA